MLYGAFPAFWGSVSLELITVSVRGFLVPFTCGSERFALWTSVGIGSVVVLELGNQITPAVRSLP